MENRIKKIMNLPIDINEVKSFGLTPNGFAVVRFILQGWGKIKPNTNLILEESKRLDFIIPRLSWDKIAREWYKTTPYYFMRPENIKRKFNRHKENAKLYLEYLYFKNSN